MRTSCDYGAVRTASNDARVVNVVVEGKVNECRGPSEGYRKGDLRRCPRMGPVHRDDGAAGMVGAW